MEANPPKVLECINAWVELNKEINSQEGCICDECESLAVSLKREKLAILSAKLSKEEFRELRMRLCY